MNSSDLIEFKLRPAIDECQLHLQRLHYAAAILEDLFPLDRESWIALSEENIAAMDQLLFRFGKLQDAMGRRLFPAILMLGVDWQEDESFIDKLNRLEKLKIIPAAAQWVEFRELRNYATHEYPDAPELNAANLNLIHNALLPLQATLQQGIDYVREHYGV